VPSPSSSPGSRLLKLKLSRSLAATQSDYSEFPETKGKLPRMTTDKNPTEEPDSTGPNGGGR